MTTRRPKFRTDLERVRRDDGQRALTQVKDPIRSVIYELNDLQLIMAELFDGRRSEGDVAACLANEHDLAIPVERVTRFVTFLERRFLLDVTCYEQAPAGMRGELKRELRRRNIHFRRDQVLGGRRRRASEAASFEAGVQQLAERRYLDAARSFAELTAHGPSDGRARAVYEALHTAFFRRHRQMPSYMRMVHLWNPDRFLGWLDARIGRMLFSAWGVALFVLLVVAGLVVVPDIDPPALRSIDWPHVLLAPFCVGIITLFLHELAHGLACKHFGGKVESMGIMLFYGVFPGAYCDVTEAQAFPNRWHRVIVYCAGVLVEVPVLSLWLWCYHLLAESFVLHNAILVWITYDIYMVVRNTVPLVKGYDGYYALSNYLDIPELNERAFAYLRQLWAEHIFGVPPQRTRITARERRIFLWFGAASAVYYVSFYYGLWFRFLFPLLVQHWHTLGLVLAVSYACRVLGTRLVRAAVHFARFVVRERRLIFTPRRSLAFVAAASVVIGILLTPYRSWADGEFIVRPRVVAAVRAGEAGQIIDIAVSEGARVRRGDIIAQLDDAELRSREQALAERVTAAQLRLLALERGERAEQVAVFARAAERARDVAGLTRTAAERSERLFAHGLLSAAGSEHATAAADVADAALQVAQRSFEWISAPTRAEDVAQARAQLAALDAQRTDLVERRTRLRLTSPSDGVVVAPRLEQRLYAHLARGQALVEVQDLAAVHGEVWFSPLELLNPLAIGDEVLLCATGDPHHASRTRIASLTQRSDARVAGVLARSAEFINPGWPSGASGHARVYFGERTIAFNLFGAPLLQLVDFSLWSHI